MKKVAEAIFLEPAYFGFRKIDGKLRPHKSRIPKGKFKDEAYQSIQMQLNAGLLESFDLTAGFVRLKDLKKIPGGLERDFDENGFGILQFHNPSQIADLKDSETICIYKIEKPGKSPFFALGK